MGNKETNHEINSVMYQMIPIIEEYVRFWAFYNEVPGVSIAIQQYDEILSAKAFGLANLDSDTPLQPDTRFRIASHSKVFTATAIMELYAAGQLSLDDKVSSHLDWFQPEEENIRIRHLLTHSSGITRDAEFGQWDHFNFPDRQQFKELITTREEIEILDPVVQIKYSNIAFTLLGQIIEKVTGISYEEYMQDLISRLDLKHTTPSIQNTHHLHATGYSFNMPGEKRMAFDHIEANVMNAATGFSSIPADILAFYRAQMQGHDRGLKYGDYFKREMQNLQFKYESTEWGLGFMRVHHHDMLFLGHGGGYPGFITFSGFNPDRELGMAVFTNTLSPPPLFPAIVGLIKYALNNHEEFRDEEDRDLSRYEGVYRGKWIIILVRQFHQQLALITLQTDQPVDTIQRLNPEGDHVFRVEDALPGAGKGERVHFSDDQLEMRGSVYKKFNYDY